MKNLARFGSENVNSKWIYFSEIPKGIEATKEMASKPTSIPKELSNYFQKVKKGAYFSITKKEAIKGSPEAKAGVEALQKVLKEKNYFQLATNALKNKKSDFRKYLEGSEKGTIGRSLFAKSLQSFDRRNRLDDSADGVYGHSSRLAVAYLQWTKKDSVKVDGAFGVKTMELLNINPITKKELGKLEKDVKKGKKVDLPPKTTPQKKTNIETTIEPEIKESVKKLVQKHNDLLAKRDKILDEKHGENWLDGIGLRTSQVIEIDEKSIKTESDFARHSFGIEMLEYDINLLQNPSSATPKFLEKGTDGVQERGELTLPNGNVFQLETSTGATRVGRKFEFFGMPFICLQNDNASISVHYLDENNERQTLTISNEKAQNEDMLKFVILEKLVDKNYSPKGKEKLKELEGKEDEKVNINNCVYYKNKINIYRNLSRELGQEIDIKDLEKIEAKVDEVLAAKWEITKEQIEYYCENIDEMTTDDLDTIKNHVNDYKSFFNWYKLRGGDNIQFDNKKIDALEAKIGFIENQQ